MGYDVAQSVAAGRNVMRCFTGHAQWSARQLEAEESVVLEAARSLDEDVDAFGEFCDETAGRWSGTRRGERSASATCALSWQRILSSAL